MTEQQMADKKTSAFTKIVYGSDKDRALINEARKTLIHADQFMYEQSLNDREYNKFVEEHNKYIDENPHLGWHKWNKLLEGGLMKGVLLPQMYDTFAVTLRYILLLVFYVAGLFFLIRLIQKF